MVDRRVPEGGSFRSLFQEQWSQLLGLLEKREEQRREEREQASHISQAIDEMVHGSNVTVPMANRYKAQLREGVNSLLSHVGEIVDHLPSSIHIHRDCFEADPYLNTFFSSADQMQRFFSNHHPLQQFFFSGDGVSCEQAHLLLFVQRMEKTVLGMGMEGDLLVRDVKQKTVQFSGHQLSDPVISEQEARSILKRVLFKNVAGFIRTGLAEVEKKARDENRSAAVWNDPKQRMVWIKNALKEPEKLLQRQSSVLRIDRMGILLTEDADEASHRVKELDLHEVGGASSSTRVVQLVSFSRDDLLGMDDMLDGLAHYLN